MALTSKRDLTPLLMWGFLVVGIIVLGVSRLGRGPDVWGAYPINFDGVFIGAYLLWMLIELRISKRDADTAGKETADSGTCLFYGSSQALTFLTALWFPSFWQEPNASHLVGMLLFLFGGCYRLWAIFTLGQFYSHKVRTVARHQIVSSGPYRYTRHPAYAGMIAANAGVCLYFANWVTIGVCLLALVPAILFRISVEEKTLFRMDGYRSFARYRKRLFPGLW